jgi:hypothetical protein
VYLDGSRAWTFSRLAIVLLLTSLAAPVAHGQPGSSVPPSDAAEPKAAPDNVATFLHSLVGEWIGTCVQSTDAKAAEDKYFHAIVKQLSPDSYETVFEYYRLDPQTGAPIQVGATTMSTTVARDGTATNRIIGKADVLIDPATRKPEQHDLSEVLRVSPRGGLEGTGSGTIKVSGMPLGAGKSGQVREYRSTWSQRDGVLSMSQHLNVKFKVLFFSRRFAMVADYTARRGSDIAGLMKRASSYANGARQTPPS